MATQNVKDFNAVNSVNLLNDSFLSVQGGELVRLNGSNATISGIHQLSTNSINITGSFVSSNRLFINGTGVLLSGEATAGGGSIEAAGFEWASSPANLSNNTDNIMPLNGTLFNTDANTFSVSNNRIGIASTGYYEFTTNLKFYDMYGDIIFLTKLMSSSTDSSALSPVTLMGRVVGDGAASSASAERGWTHTTLVPVSSPGYYAIVLNPSINTPYPSDTENTKSKVFVKKIHN